MADVFISYKSQDREWAAKIDTLVRSAGYTTWWDTSLQTGQRYNERIANELEEARVTIVIWSRESWRSPWVKEEALFARERERLVPVRIDSVEIGVPFFSLQTLDMSNWSGDFADVPAVALLDSLERFVPKKLSRNYVSNVYWINGNDGIVKDTSAPERLLQKIATKCRLSAVHINVVHAWDHIVNPHMIRERSEYERDLNTVVFFGGVTSDGFFRDVFDPGLDKLLEALNPYFIHVGHDEGDLWIQSGIDRRCELADAVLPDPDSPQGNSVAEAVAGFLVFRILEMRVVLSSSHGDA